MRAHPPNAAAAEACEQTVVVEGQAFQVRPGAGRQAFWDRLNAGQWEPQTFRAFRRFLEPRASCIDIGAWIGPTALYAAGLARRVHAIEPDPVAHAELVGNVQANVGLARRIAPHELCIAPENGPIALYAGGMYLGAASAFGDSMSGIVPTQGPSDQPRRQVRGVRLTDFMEANAVADCGFIKMDVEGGEFSLIPGRWRELAAFGMPTLCVSFHAPAAGQREALIGACLEELRGCYRHLYAAGDQSLLDTQALMAGVGDWADNAPASPWRRLEAVLGDGVVASNGAW